MKQAAPGNPTVHGAKYRQTFQAMVSSIVGPSAPPVYSRGSYFYNVDKWTSRILVKNCCAWALQNPGCVPTKEDVEAWVTAANDYRPPKREIVVASCPDRLPRSILYGIQGGGCHEGFHTVYSCRRSLTVDEVVGILIPRWPLIPNWEGVHGLLQEWGNIVEDIRIERLGRVEFPGTDPYLHDLQDFILKQETAGFQDLRAHSGNPESGKRNKLTIISAAFRDYGLGYRTETQMEAWQGYLEEDPAAVEFVMQGPLRPLVDQAILLSAQDDLGYLRVAMDCVIQLVKASKQNTSSEEAKSGQPGDGKIRCPKCGAPAHQLIVRPKSDGQGGTVKGKGICTCTACNHQQEVDVTDRKRPKTSQERIEDAQPPGPRFEGWDPEPKQQGEESSPQGEGREPGEESGVGSPGSEEEEEQVEPLNLSSGGGNVGGAESPTTNQPDDHREHQEVAGQALQEALAGKNPDLLDGSSALGQAIRAEEDKQVGAVLKGEQPYRPWDPGLDIVCLVDTPDRKAALKKARQILDSVKQECSYFRSRLANIAKAVEMTDTVHGLRKGRKLSEKLLVNTYVDILSGAIPQRAYQDTSSRVDLSMAVAVVIDESSSMSLCYERAVPGEMGDGTCGCIKCGSTQVTVSYNLQHGVFNTGEAVCLDCGHKAQVQLRGKKEDASRMLLAITEPCERLGFSVQCSGFRDGGLPPQSLPEPSDQGRYHRVTGKTHDVFKRFDEKLRDVLYRFALIQAKGCTPLADGIQFGLESLSCRNEAHRVLLVLTDGEPTEGQEVIPWQLRIAKEAGIHVIGVGIGQGSEGVMTHFDDYVWDKDISRIPKLLVKKLNDLVDLRTSKRGRRIKKAK